MIRNVRELKAHAGPRFKRWRRGVAHSVGGVLLEELELLQAEEANRAPDD